MLAIAPPLKTFAGAFKMTGAPKSHAVHQAGITRAFKFMDTGLKERRVVGLEKVSLGERLKAVAYSPVACKACSPASAPDQVSAVFRKVRLGLTRSVHRPLPLHLSAGVWPQLKPEHVVPEWKRRSPILLRPEGLYGTRPAKGGNKASKLKVIRKAFVQPNGFGSATDCDREGQLIGKEILEHYKYRGEVMRVLFTAQDLTEHPRRIWPGKAERRMIAAFKPPPLRGGRPTKFITVTHPNRDCHTGSRYPGVVGLVA